MSQRSSLLGTGLDRVRATVNTATKELRRVQKRVETQRRTLEKSVSTRRKALERRASKQLDRVLDQVRGSALLKSADALRLGATRQIEAGVESVLGVLQIPTRSELARIDRKLSQISRKLRDLERDSAAA